jgi:scyllo-inositol 2-dehydrogenase (NADP+)
VTPGEAGPPLRVGLIGYGLAGAVLHAPLIAAEPRLELTSVVTSNAERAARVQSEHPRARVLPTPDALWERATEHDVVVVAAPNREHVSLGLGALAAGLHLVVDKPVAPSSAGARLLRDTAVGRGLTAVPFHNRRWDGDALTLRGLLERGELGRVLRFESSFERWRPQVDAQRWRERADPGDAGGVLFDLGSHLIDQALWLFGPAELTHAEIRAERDGAAVDDDAFLALVHASGVRSHLHASLVTAQPGPRMRVLGSQAAWVKHGMDPQEAALRTGADPRASDFGREPAADFGLLGAASDALSETTADGRLKPTNGGPRPVETVPGRYLSFYTGLADAILAGAPSPVAFEDAIRGLELIESARLFSAARD